MAKVAAGTKKARLSRALQAKVQKRNLPKTQKPLVSEAHKAVIDAWFANGCVSKKRALLAVGYSDHTASSNAHSVFNREDVQAEIRRRQNIRAGQRDTSEERIIEEMAKLAFVNFGDLLEVNEDGSAYLDLNQMTDDHRAALIEFQVETYDEKVYTPPADEGWPPKETDAKPGVSMVPVKKSKMKFASKQAALDSLARIRGLFKDKIEVSGVQSLVERIAAARGRVSEAAKTEREKFK